MFKNRHLIVVYIVLLFKIGKAQTANYVGNGSFEDLITCSGSIDDAKYWNYLDSLNGGFILTSKCNGSVPFNGFTYQWPRTENNFAGSITFFCVPPSCHLNLIEPI